MYDGGVMEDVGWVMRVDLFIKYDAYHWERLRGFQYPVHCIERYNPHSHELRENESIYVREGEEVVGLEALKELQEVRKEITENKAHIISSEKHHVHDILNGLELNDPIGTHNKNKIK